MKEVRQAVILCGGLGTRLRPFTDHTPKPLAPVNGRPFLEHLMGQMSDHGIRQFLLLTGYLGGKIEGYFGNGNAWGWDIVYSEGPVEWDTGQRLWEARQQMESRFVLLYSDNFVQFPAGRLWARHVKEQVPLSLLLAPKEKGNIRVSSCGRIEAYDKTRLGVRLDYVEVGYMIFERDPVLELFPAIESHPQSSFSDVIKRLAETDQVAGLVVRDSYHSISDPDRLELMRGYLKPKKLVLIDRDGVINRKAPKGEYIETWEEFDWVPETRSAMRALAAQGFGFIVISNQAGVARGMIEPAALERIHHNMAAELRSDGIQIANIYVCPHHWDDHCECRKPEPGLFFQAAHEHLLRMDRTVYVGDDSRDCLAAQNAGCLSVLVGAEHQECNSAEVEPWLTTETLGDSVDAIVNLFRDWEEHPIGCRVSEHGSPLNSVGRDSVEP